MFTNCFLLGIITNTKAMEEKMVTDLTKGNPDKTLWKFTLPMIISVMFQQLYSTVDSIVAGQFAGVNALAAVGASYPITMLFIAVANGSNIGCSVVISQLFGGKRITHMKRLSIPLLSHHLFYLLY